MGIIFVLIFKKYIDKYLLVLVFFWICCKRVVVFLVNMGLMIMCIFFIFLWVKLFFFSVGDFSKFLLFGDVEECFLILVFCFIVILFWFVVL